jgi:cell division septation protein DedD
MSRLSRRVRTGLLAGVVAGTVTLAVVVPGGGAAAASRPQVRHATLSSVVERIPNYFPGVVHWKVSTSWRHYGTTDWDTNTVTISAFTPLNLLYSVVAHEWSHEIQAFDYHRDFWGLIKSMNRHFGGAGSSGQRGVEYAADCMAIVLGATWTDYTSCHNNKWRQHAKRLLKGHRLTSHHRHHKASGTAAYPIADPTTAKPTSSKPTSSKPTNSKPTSSKAPDAYPVETTNPSTHPQPEPYRQPPAYTINWGPTWGR